jgi:hypothetical protein
MNRVHKTTKPPSPEEVLKNAPPPPRKTLEMRIREAGLTEKEVCTFLSKARNPIMSDQEACRLAGYKQPSGAVVKVWQHISSKLGPLMQILDVDERQIGQAIKDALHATKKVVSYKTIYDEKGKPTQKTPVILEIPDHPIRLKAVELAVRSDRFHVKHEHEHSLKQKDETALDMLEKREEQAVSADFEVVNEAS